MVIAVPVAALVLVMAGCGSSSSSAVDTTATVQSTDTSGGTDTSAMSTDTGVTDTSGGTDTSASTDTSGGTDTGASTDTTGSTGSISTGGCKNLSNLGAKFAQALGAATNASGKPDLEATAKAYKAFAEQAPEEIRGAFRTVADAFSAYAEALKGVDLSSGKTPDAATLAKIAGAAKSLDNSKLTAANVQIEAWVKKNCSTGG